MNERALDILYAGTLPPHPGGSAVSAAQLLGGFAARGHRVRALSPATEAQLDGGDPFAARQPEIAVRRFIVPFPYTTAYRPAAAEYLRIEGEAIRRLLPSMIAERPPDLVLIGRESFAWHVPGIAASHSLPCLLRAAGATTVGILEGTYPPSLAGPLLAQYRRTDLVITPSEYLARELRRLGVQNVKAVLNAIDLRRFRPGPKDPRLVKELGIDGDAIVIAYAGNLNERKRPLDVVHSSVEVLKRCPGVVYLVVGDGTEWRRTVQAARDLRVDHRFRYVGWQAYEDMPKYINLSDIVVSPSFGEGLARVYLEAQACSRVLISSDIPPAREVVRDGESGLLFPVGDVDGLSARCIEAARDPGLRARIGRAAFERVQHHDIGAAVERYLGEFRAIARRPDTVRPAQAGFSPG